MLAEMHEREPLRCGILEVAPDGSSARLGGEELQLTFAQRLVLAKLLERVGKAWTRQKLYEEAMGREFPRGSRAIDQHIAEIRRALGPRRGAIRSIDRVGYRLDPSLLL